LRQILDRPDTHAMPDVGVDRYALHRGVDTELAELRMNALGNVLIAVRADLQEIDARPVDLGGGWPRREWR
jgi:hypothetical protein